MPTKKKLHCKHCGGITHLSNTVGGYLELKPEQLSPWRCSHCGAVYEFKVEGDPNSGYRLANDPDREKREDAVRRKELEQEQRELRPWISRSQRRKMQKAKGRSKKTRIKRKARK